MDIRFTQKGRDFAAANGIDIGQLEDPPGEITITNSSTVGLTPAAQSLFLEYANAAPSWGNTPWIFVANDSNGLNTGQYADIDAMEKAGLIVADRKRDGQLDLENGTIFFTKKGRDLASSLGINVDSWLDSDLKEPRVFEEEAPVTLPPLDERTFFERFVSALSRKTRPPSVEGDPHTQGISDPNFGIIADDAVDPNAVQADYTRLGWEDQRAAEIAEAARSRPSLLALQELVLRAFAIRQGRVIPTDPGERMDLEEQIEDMIKRAYGLDYITAGSNGGLTFDNVTVDWQYSEYDSMIRIEVSADNLNEDLEQLGSIERELRIYVNGDQETYAHNSLFRLNQGDPNAKMPTGASEAYNRWMENWYIANGVSYVDVQAAGGGGAGRGSWNGAARWALNNFFWQDENEPENRLSLFQSRINGMPANSPADIRQKERAQRDLDRLRYLQDEGLQPSPLQFVMAGWRAGMRRDWFGYAAMVSQTWYGKKDLVPDSISSVEAEQYAEIYQVARDRIENQDNAFEYNAELETLLGTANSYADPSLAGLAPFRDEFEQFFSENADGDQSLASLSPPARDALYAWSSNLMREFARTTEGMLDADIFRSMSGNVDPKVLMRLSLQLRDEAKAYDKTPLQAGLDDALFSKMTTQDITAAFRSGDFITIDGVESRYKVAEEIAQGVNPHYRIKNVDTGQSLWVKFKGNRHINSISEEMNANMVQRMLNLRGASYMMTNDNEDMVIATAAGSGIRGASPAQNAGEFIEVSPNNYIENLYYDVNAISISDLAGMAVLDSVIYNVDRHIENWMFSDLGSNGPLDGSQIPFAIDHGGADMAMMLRDISYYEDAPYQRLPWSNAIQVLRNGVFVSSVAAHKVAMAEASRNAIKRIENSGLYDLNDASVKLILSRLRSISSWYE
jgi:hypothetical protein